MMAYHAFLLIVVFTISEWINANLKAALERKVIAKVQHYVPNSLVKMLGVNTRLVKMD